MPGEQPEGVILFGLSGEAKGIDGVIEAIISYGPPIEDYQTGEVVTILVHIAQTDRVVPPDAYATKFEVELREQFREMSDFFSVQAATDEDGTDLGFLSSYEVDRKGFDYLEVIDELLGYMLEALPKARKLLNRRK